MSDQPPAIAADKEYIYEGRAEVTFRFVVPGAAVLRCIENWTDEDRPARDGERGWRDSMYPLSEEEDVVKHLAYNLALRSRSLDQLDGWADIEDPEKAANRFARRYEGDIEDVDIWDFKRTERNA